jgi:DNA-binding response OmpR family regulator
MTQNHHSKLLLIDDSEDIAVLVEQALIPLGITMETALTVKDALMMAQKTNYDFLIIDIMLPDGDGFDVFSKIRAIPHYEKVPAIFLTGKDDVGSKISAFSLGADDYMVKPFHLLELRARVESKLKKQRAGSEGTIFSTGPFIFDIQYQRIKTQGGKTEFSLTAREFKILLLLGKNPDQVFTREEILKKIWGENVYVTNRTVDAHICYLRKKLNRFSSCIESIPSEGYRFNPTPNISA